MTCQIYDNSLFKKITIAITFQHYKIFLLSVDYIKSKKQLKIELLLLQNKLKLNFIFDFAL
ncbi:hypothetical protein B0A65_11665 [Flavobacterium frigidimaris]|uniref:Uncharacterized protein n=1 Tax=Flavobacterium frigidimaris TaxID=262320 RepID=A0ABX4BQN6_FLAFR|nr:hypothetical protein B0A65_11665 [Flavobacterium frigidimaris]